MTGADVAIALRADPTTREVHIIMCTGTAEVTVRERFTWGAVLPRYREVLGL